jgi:hypothetical protein
MNDPKMISHAKLKGNETHAHLYFFPFPEFIIANIERANPIGKQYKLKTLRRTKLRKAKMGNEKARLPIMEK